MLHITNSLGKIHLIYWITLIYFSSLFTFFLCPLLFFTHALCSKLLKEERSLISPIIHLMIILIHCMWNSKSWTLLNFIFRILIIIYNRPIGIMVIGFANGPGYWDSIPDRVIPKTQKWYLMSPCLMSPQHY